jgi:Lrp/AsnC family transcriptional regulator, cysteine-sensing transcriptional activator
VGSALRYLRLTYQQQERKALVSNVELRNTVARDGGFRGSRCVDKIDQKILALLQSDSSLTAEEVGERVGLSKAPCWRRIERLTKTGVILRTVAILDPKLVNLKTTVFVMVRTSSHSTDWIERFAKAVQKIPEVIELHRMSGDVDYLLRIVVPDIAGYDAVYKKMISAVQMSDVSASFVLETIKSTTTLPLHYLPLR